MYGSSLMADYVFDRPNTKICNLTSLAERYAKFRLPLVPPNSLGSSSEYEFDVNYMHWILDYDSNFMIFMNEIIVPLYAGTDIFLVVSEDDWSQIISESLLKLIQQRYGVIALCVHDPDDLIYAEDASFAEGYGIFNLDSDVERYERLFSQYQYSTGMVISDDYNIGLSQQA